MNKVYKSKIYFITSFIIILLVTIFALNSIKNNNIDKYLEKENEKFNLNYNVIYNNYKKIADLIFKIDIQDEKILTLFSNRDREGLKNYLDTKYADYYFNINNNLKINNLDSDLNTDLSKLNNNLNINSEKILNILSPRQKDYKVLIFPWHWYLEIDFIWKTTLASISNYFWKNIVLFWDNLEMWSIYSQSNRTESQIIETYISSSGLFAKEDNYKQYLDINHLNNKLRNENIFKNENNDNTIETVNNYSKDIETINKFKPLMIYYRLLLDINKID